MNAMAIVGLRLIALFLAVQALAGLASLITSLVGMEFSGGITFMIQVIGLFPAPLGGAVLLYLAAGPIARRLCHDQPEDILAPVSTASLQASLICHSWRLSAVQGTVDWCAAGGDVHDHEAV